MRSMKGLIYRTSGVYTILLQSTAEEDEEDGTGQSPCRVKRSIGEIGQECGKLSYIPVDP